MARHYATTVMPARPYKPRDKAKVEQSVLLVERWILARLRNQRFFSAAELNLTIASLVTDLNARIMRGYGASRAELFATLDASPQTTPNTALCFRRLEALQSSPRLPCRGRWLLVLRPVSADP